MGYLDVWIYDSRPRMKVFLCYLLIFIAFFIFSDVMIYLYTKSLYKPINNCEINSKNVEVIIEKAEASNVNGNVKGKIINKDEETVENKYLKFDFYTPRNVKVGTKYIEINNLHQNDEREYELGFKYDNVSNIKISLIDKEEVTNATPEDFKIDPVYGPAGLISLLILGHFFL